MKFNIQMDKLKVNIQMFAKRLYPIIGVFCVLLLCAMPASAAILSWVDYILDYDEDSVTCQLPNSDYLINIMQSGSVVSTYTGSTVSYSFPSGVIPRFQVYPMGAKNRMRLSDIPDGTILQYSVTFTQSGSKALHGNLIAYIQYFDADIDSLGSTIIASGEGTLPKTFDITHVMDFPDGAEYFTLWFYLQGWDTLTAATSMGISCTPLTFTMDIQYLPDDSAILNSINDQLNDLNGKIDNAINGSQEDQDKVDDAVGDIGSNIDKIEDGMNQLETVPTPDFDIDDLMPGELDGLHYIQFAQIISLFWENELLRTMMTLLGTFILFSVILHGEK